MVFDIINIIEHNNYKNKSIKMTKNNQPLKVEKGPWKGGPVRRLLRASDKPNGFESEHTIKKHSKKYYTTANFLKGSNKYRQCQHQPSYSKH